MCGLTENTPAQLRFRARRSHRIAAAQLTPRSRPSLRASTVARRGRIGEDRGVSRLTRPLAWAMAVAALAASVVAVVVVAVAAGRGIPDVPSPWGILPLVVGVGAPACVGLVLVLRRPGTGVAWILLAGALSVGLVMAGFAVGNLAVHDDPRSATGAWALVLATEWVVLFLWPLALAYVFPDGHLPSPRWRLPAALALASAVGAVLLLSLIHI